MKKLILLFVLIFVFNCKTFNSPIETNNQSKEKIGIVDSTGKVIGEIPLNDLKNLQKLAEKYVSIRETSKNGIPSDNIQVLKIDNDRYKVSIKLGDEVSAIIIIKATSQELEKLREKYNKIITTTPSVQIERLGKSDIFNIEMTVDDIKWNAQIRIDVNNGWNWTSFWAGASASTFFIVLIKVATSNVIYFLL
jgi:hypothetical protein